MALQASLLRSSFTSVSDQGEQLMLEFYRLLFERYPAVVPLFSKTEMSSQRKKLLAALALVVRNLESPETLTKVLGEMGKRHLKYGALPAHYPAVGQCLLDALAHVSGSAWTPGLHSAWADAYAVVAGLMLSGVETTGMAA